MARGTRIVAVFVAALVVPACSKKSDDDAPPPPLAPTALAAVLGGTQVDPVAVTAAAGTLTLSVAGDGTSIEFTLTTTVASPQSAHLHVGVPGVSGPALFNLSAGAFTSPISGTLTSADFVAGGGVATFGEAVAAVLAGSAYVDVHSGAFPLGEVRGQVGPAAVAAVRLSGAQERPAVTGAGTGSASFTLNGTQTSIAFSLTVSGLSSAVSAAHLHIGEAGIEGSFMFTLASADFTTITGTLTAADFTPVPGVATFAEAVNALLSGLTYVNVHTASFIDGEVRGQVGPVRLGSALGGAQEVPAVTTAGSGSGLVLLNGLQNAATVTLSYASLSGTTTAAHIHLEEPGFDGSILIPLAAATFASPLTVNLTSTDVTPANVASLLSGATYFNIHTTSFTGGEIRGQIGAATVASVRMSRTQEVGGTATAANGSARLDFSGSQTSIVYSVTVASLSGAATGAHIHLGEEGENGTILFTLTNPAPTSTGLLTNATPATSPSGLSVSTFAGAVNHILAGLTYVNVHTAAFTGGEVRGQVGAARMEASLDGAQEVPMVTTTGTGTGAVALNGLQTRATVTLSYANLTGTATDAHIHQGPVGVDGGVLITLATGGVPTPLTLVLTSGDVTPPNVDVILSGLTYFNIHSTTQSGGEIRGQILP